MTLPPEDEARFLLGALDVIGRDVALRLWERGWTPTKTTLEGYGLQEWFWPPTAPEGYSGSPGQDRGAANAGVLHEDGVRPSASAPSGSPWLEPTRLTRVGDSWRLDHGRARGHEPDASRSYVDLEELIADLPRIEWWPMPPEEAHRIIRDRLFEIVSARAHDSHDRLVALSEPYASRARTLNSHLEHEEARRLGRFDAPAPTGPAPHGDLRARLDLLLAEAWASDERNRRAGTPPSSMDLRRRS